MAALLQVADALAQVLQHAAPLPSQDVPLNEAAGRVLAADVAARITQPAADVSAMDGYAVRAEDVTNAPATLRVIGEVAAGHPFAAPVGPGETARIFTGGVLPDGADAVVMVEQTRRAPGDGVDVMAAAAVGQNIGLSLAVFGLLDAPSAYVDGVTPARIGAVALSVALTGGGLRLLRAAHPPAGATTIIVSSGLLAKPGQMLAVAVGVVVLTVVCWCLNRMLGVPAPRWAAPA